jgi:hypothetical protein
MSSWTFEELRPAIEDAIKKTLNCHPEVYNDPKQYLLVPGILVENLQSAIGVGWMLGQGFPRVAIIGNSTGEIHYFSLGVLLPDIRFDNTD